MWICEKARPKAQVCEGIGSVFLTAHLNLSLFAVRQIATAGKVNKHVARLGLAADALFSRGCVVL